jgi:hypothetical protein
MEHRTQNQKGLGQDGIPYDSIGYGITKEDWKNGKATPVNWNDFKC